VRRLGRELTERVGLRGFAKFDFKRDPDGRLWLLQVNPRFNLWHHVGADAGQGRRCAPSIGRHALHRAEREDWQDLLAQVAEVASSGY